MAKSAKHTDVEITQKLVNGVIKKVMEAFEDIESLRGKFMNGARRHREVIAAEYERAAVSGIPQKIMKLQVEIERLEKRIKGKIAELESENQKMLRKVLKAHGNKAQLALLLDMPVAKKPKQADIVDLASRKEAANAKEPALHAAE